MGWTCGGADCGDSPGWRLSDPSPKRKRGFGETSRCPSLALRARIGRIDALRGWESGVNAAEIQPSPRPSLRGRGVLAALLANLATNPAGAEGPLFAVRDAAGNSHVCEAKERVAGGYRLSDTRVDATVAS